MADDDVFDEATRRVEANTPFVISTGKRLKFKLNPPPEGSQGPRFEAGSLTIVGVPRFVPRSLELRPERFGFAPDTLSIEGSGFVHGSFTIAREPGFVPGSLQIDGA